MSEIKPLGMLTADELACIESGATAIIIPLGDVLPDDDCTKLYAIPDTHRIVSVDTLQRIEQFATEARDHYSGMNDEVCQSYSEPWQQGVAVCEELHAIIANK